MIPFDFEYFQPTTIQEAIETYQRIHKHGKKAIYFCGGTEFITFARINKAYADAVIDIKGITECHTLKIQDQDLIIGAAVNLNKIAESNLFPLMGQAVKHIADHTSRNKITIGGNINSRLIYREGILPLLLTDAKVKIAGTEGEMVLPFSEVYHKNIQLHPGQFIVQILIDQSYLNLRYVSLKKTKMSKVGYPVVSISALVKENQIRAAFSGVCEYPFRSEEIEEVLNNSAMAANQQVDEIAAILPKPIVNDLLGSAEYREFVFKHALLETIEALKGAIS